MEVKTPIWQPREGRIRNANMTRFISLVNERYEKNLSSYEELYNWSIKSLADFWRLVWEFGEIRASRPYDEVMSQEKHIIDTRWFSGARLNFAENMLRYRDNKAALVFRGETGKKAEISYSDLYKNVARLANALRDIGIKPGDRIAGFMPNMIETVVAMLASTGIGAIWSSCSPEFGTKAVIDRFGQTEPKVLFTADGYYYNGKIFYCLEKVAVITKELPSIQRVAVVPFIESNPKIDNIDKSVHYSDFLSRQEEITFEQLPPDHPLYIMYTSGTTGLPKCIVQGAAGILINHLKELKLHADVKREDVVFYFTTCGWMMWNWLISSLALGATILLFDGSPFYPDAGVLWQLIEDEGITVFGTSARYIAEIEKRGLKPGKKYNLNKLKTVLSTGSPLAQESFEFVYRDIKEDLLLSSISGGTDINGCFISGNPVGPVYSGECQCLGLGMKVEAFDSEGNSVIGHKGELVCTNPVPSMPLCFWNDEDKRKYWSTYFDKYPNVWTHGDYIEITPTGIIIYGRSDTALNPGGVRIGTAEIYRQVDIFEEIEDSVVVGQNWQNDVRIVLFVKLKKGVKLTEDLIGNIKSTIRKNTTPRHVPAKVIAVDDIPYTMNMKKVEIAVRNVINDEPVTNVDALVNPQSLEHYKNLEELQS